MRARYYNIDIKRFINQDILIGSIDSSQSLNRYAYVEGNPVNFLDPFGLEKSDNDDLHKFYQGASTISFIVGGVTAIAATFLTGGAAAIVMSASTVASTVGTLSMGVDFSLYVEDFKTGTSYEKRVAAIDGMTSVTVDATIGAVFKKIGKTTAGKAENKSVKEIVKFIVESIGEIINSQT